MTVAARSHPPPIADALRSARSRRAEQLRALAGWVAVPSISGDDRRRGAVLRAGAVLAELLRTAGAAGRRIPVPDAPPLVVARADGPPGSPVVLVYGHYDVVAPGPGWTAAAFRPVLRGRLMLGRGTNDDKGQLMATVAALDAWHRAGGPPSTVWVVAEGAEEVGSPGLADGLAALRGAARPDLVLVCDTERAPDGVPSVTVSQRGHLDLTVEVDTGGAPVHPGRLGGAVVDPGVVLGRVIGRLSTALGTDSSPALRHPRLRDRSDGQVAAVAGRATAGSDLDRRITSLPALSVLRLTAGGSTRAVPTRARAELDVRLPPTADPGAQLRLLRRAARRATPAGVRLTVTARAAHAGHEAVPGAASLAALDAACRAAVGRPVRLLRSGGSLPAVTALTDAFSRTPVLLGLGTSGGAAHGPDEHLDVVEWASGVDLLVRLFAEPGPGTTATRGQRPRSQVPCGAPGRSARLSALADFDSPEETQASGSPGRRR